MRKIFTSVAIKNVVKDGLKNFYKVKKDIEMWEKATEADIRVIAIIDSYFACSEDIIKAELAGKIAEYAGCPAWYCTMEYLYDNT